MSKAAPSPLECPQNGPDDRAAIDADIQSVLGRKLQSAFSPILDEPIPDRFIALMKEIASREKAK